MDWKDMTDLVSTGLVLIGIAGLVIYGLSRIL